MSEAKRSNSEFNFPHAQHAAAMTWALNTDESNRRLAKLSPGSADSLTTTDFHHYGGADPYNSIGRFVRARASG